MLQSSPGEGSHRAHRCSEFADAGPLYLPPFPRGLMVRDARRRAPHHEGLRPHPEEPPTGPREARPDDKLRGVSKDEATELENALSASVNLRRLPHPNPPRASFARLDPAKSGERER